MICKRFSFGIFVFVAAVAGGVTIHRSFATRDVGFGGGASVSVPVDSRVAMAVYEADEREANRTKVYVGRVTRVSDGDTIWILTTGGNTKVKVRLDRIDAPESDQPFGKESAAYLKQLIGGREVRIEYQKRDQYGRVLGIVYLAKEDVNLKMVAEGMAWHYSHFDKTPAYAAAEVAARQAKKGLWAAENPINPYRWRKGDRTAKAPPAVSKFAAGNDPTNDSAALPSVRKEYFAGPQWMMKRVIHCLSKEFA